VRVVLELCKCSAGKFLQVLASTAQEQARDKSVAQWTVQEGCGMQ
jgi:hypothetical protein